MEERITFKKLDKKYYETLKEWWHSERVKQFWDNSEEMEEDVDNYVLKGQKSYYEYYKDYLSKTGKTFAIDFMIGNENFVGKHLSSLTLRTFVEQYSDKDADRFIIDPEYDNEIAFKC